MTRQFEGKLCLFLSMVALFYSVVWSVMFCDMEMALWAIVALMAVVTSIFYLITLNEVGKNG